MSHGACHHGVDGEEGMNRRVDRAKSESPRERSPFQMKVVLVCRNQANGGTEQLVFLSDVVDSSKPVGTISLFM